VSALEIEGVAVTTGPMTVEKTGQRLTLEVPMLVIIEAPWDGDTVAAFFEAGAVGIVLSIPRPKEESK